MAVFGIKDARMLQLLCLPSKSMLPVCSLCPCKAFLAFFGIFLFCLGCMFLHISPQKNREDCPAGKYCFYFKWILGKLVQSNFSRGKQSHHVILLYVFFVTHTWIPKGFSINFMGKWVECWEDRKQFLSKINFGAANDFSRLQDWKKGISLFVNLSNL